MTPTENRRTRPVRLVAALALAGALGLGAATPAQASSTKKNDPRGDAFEGTETSMDLAGITMKTQGRDRIRITYRLHNPVTTTNLADPGGMAVEFSKNKRTLRSVRITAVDGALQGSVCSYDLRKDIPPPTSCTAVPVTQLDDRTFRAVVKRKQIKKNAKVLRWYASVFDMSVMPFSIDALGKGAVKPFRWKL